MAILVQDQKSFLVGLGSSSQQIKLSEGYFQAVQELVNFDVLPDGSIRPRKRLAQKYRIQRPEGLSSWEQNKDYWVFDEFYIHKEGRRVFITLNGNKIELDLSYTEVFQEFFNGQWNREKFFDTGINFPEVVNLRKVKQIKSTYFLLFDNFFFKLKYQNQVIQFYPFFMNDYDQNDIQTIINKFPFFGLNKNENETIDVKMTGYANNSADVQVVTKRTNLLNNPLICSPEPVNFDISQLITQARRTERTGRPGSTYINTSGFHIYPYRWVKEVRTYTYGGRTRTYVIPVKKKVDRPLNPNPKYGLLGSLKNELFYANQRWITASAPSTFSLTSLDNINRRQETLFYTQRFKETEPAKYNKRGDTVIRKARYSSSPTTEVEPDEKYKLETKSLSRTIPGLSVSSKYFFRLFQCMLNRFYFIVLTKASSPNADGEIIYSGRLTSFGEFSLDDLDFEFTTENFFVSDFLEGWPVDVQEFEGKLIFGLRNGSVLFSDYDKTNILSHPIKSLMNNRSIDGLKYNEQNYPGPSQSYLGSNDGHNMYMEFLKDIPSKGVSFTLSDPLGFKIKETQLKTLSAHSLYVNQGNFIRTYAFTDNGIYQLGVSGINSRIKKVSNFIIKDGIEPLEIDEYLIWTDGESLFAADLNNSNNSSLIFKRIVLSSVSAIIGNEVKDLKRLDSKSFLCYTDRGVFRLFVLNSQFLGCSEYKTDTLFNGIIENGVLSDGGMFQFAEWNEKGAEDNMFCYGKLFPFTISNFYPAHAYFYHRTLQYLYILKDPDLTDIRIGCGNSIQGFSDENSARVKNRNESFFDFRELTTSIEQLKADKTPLKTRLQKISRSETYNDDKCFMFGYRFKREETPLKIYGLNFVFNSQGDI